MNEPLALKPLEDVINVDTTPIKKDEFINGLIKWGTVISGRNSGGSGAVVYTVPKGKTLFVLSCCLSAESTDGAGCVVNLQTGSFAGGQIVLCSLIPKAKDVNLYLSSTFHIPIKINAEESIRIITSGAVPSCDASLIGYLVETNVLQNFL